MAELSIEELVELQLDLESEGYDQGISRYHRKIKQAIAGARESEADGGKHTLKKHLDDMASILALIAASKTEDQWPRKMRDLIKAVGYDVAAVMVMQSVVDGISHRRKPVALAAEIIEHLVTEVRVRAWSYSCPGLWKYWAKRFTEKGTSHYGHRKKVMDAAMRSTPLEFPSDVMYEEMEQAEQMTLEWIRQHEAKFATDRKMQLKCGLKLINVVAEVTDIIERVIDSVNVHKGRRTNLYIQVKPEYTEYVAQIRSDMENHAPIHYPTVIPPLPWGPSLTGGYHGTLKGVQPLVRQYRADPSYYSKAKMPEVYDALNAVQDTPWTINTEVLDVLRVLRDGDGETAGLPRFEPPAIRQAPQKADFKDPEVFEEKLAAWKREKTELLDVEVPRASKVREVDATLRVADKFADRLRIWFPHNLDWRGRMYPIPNFLQPQGSDLERGLLLFYRGKALGEDGKFWLAVHGANCMGKTPEAVGARALDKTTLQERSDWIQSQEERIRETAAHPLGTHWWRDAEKPFQFLAFCFEWVRCLDEGVSYQCRLPVHIDGSCNGIQHFSAMLRDEVGGAAVNLTPTPDGIINPDDFAPPNDLYTEVSDAVQRILGEQEDAEGEEAELAKMWLDHGVDRKLAKRPTMTFGYGSKPYGMGNQLLDHLGTRAHPSFKLEDDEVAATKRRTTAACRHMARTLWQALSETVTAAYDAMEWMQQCVRIVLRSSGECFEWVAPTGFPVRQNYLKMKKVRIKTMLAGSMYWAVIYKVDGRHKPAPTEQVNGVAPNFVHSLDASAMIRTVNAAWDAGIEDFAMVHDSYGTLPTDVENLGEVTREEFIRLYTDHDPIAEFLAACEAQHDGGQLLPEPPERGDLDLNGIRDSMYFFS